MGRARVKMKKPHTRAFHAPRLQMPLAAAAVTAMVLWAALYLGDFVPFGVNTPAVTDAKLQYLDLFAYCRDVLTGQNTAAYTFSNTLGGSAVAIWTYYLASPFNLLVLLFPKEQMNLFLEVLITVKCSAASAAFAWMIGERYRGRIRGSIALVLSVSYGLMQYMLAQGSNVMWLDGVILLPFIALGVHRIVGVRTTSCHTGQGLAKPVLGLAVPAALSVIFNWYTGGINYLFSFVWLFYEMLRRDRKRTVDRGGRVFALYFGAMALGLLLASFLFVPSVIALRNGKGAGWNPVQALGTISPGLRGNPLSVLRSYRIGEISDSQRVSLFCGSLALFGTTAFFMSGRIPRRGKIAGAGVCLFTVMSYFWQPLFRVFSLLQFSDSYWYRYGYLGSFVLLDLAAYWAGSLPVRGGVRNRREWAVIPKAGAFCILMMAVSRRIWPSGGGGTTRTAVLMLLIITGLAGAIWAPMKTIAISERARRAAAAALAVVCLTESFLQARAMLTIYHTDTAQEYEIYSRQAQAQIDALKTYDSGFYRVNQTSTRIGNKDGLTAAYLDAMAYGYASVSGYTSCPENTQLTFLDKLGYRKEYESFNIVNTSFLPADSLLGVKYVLSGYDMPGLTKMETLGTYNGKAVYENPFVLPVAMICGPETEAQREEQGGADLSGAVKGAWGQKKQGLPSASDPFPYLERLYSKLAGQKTDLFVPVEAERHYADGMTTWTLQVPAGRFCLYGNLPWEEPMEGRLTVSKDWGYGYGDWLSPSVFYIPVPDEERTVRITLETQGEPNLRAAQFEALDLAVLAESAERIRAKAAAVKRVEIGPGEVICTAEGEAGQHLVLTIPYSQGWTAYVNGQKTQIEAFEGTLIQIPLVQGENHITMQYRVPGAGAGRLLSLLGAGLAAAWIIWEKKRKRGYRS
jgi:uncharacterized membrane protein YfhO